MITLLLNKLKSVVPLLAVGLVIVLLSATGCYYDKEEKLASIINASVARGGNIIIPSFAVGRTQSMLYYLHNLLK